MPQQSQLRPAVINAKMVFRIGIILWVLGLATLTVLHYTGTSVPGRYPIISGAGILLGAIGYWWAHRNHMISPEGTSQS